MENRELRQRWECYFFTMEQGVFMMVPAPYPVMAIAIAIKMIPVAVTKK